MEFPTNGRRRQPSVALKMAKETSRTFAGPARGSAGLRVALFDEAGKEFERFHHDLAGVLNPKDKLDDVLVERIAICAWRLRRIPRIESGLFAKARVSATNGKLKRTRDIELVFLRLTSGDDVVAKLTRYEASLERSLHQAIVELRTRQFRQQLDGRLRQLTGKGKSEGERAVAVTSSPFTQAPVKRLGPWRRSRGSM